MFSSKDSSVSALKVRPLIHFELLFVYGVGEGYDFLYCSGGFWWQEHWSGLPFPPPVDCVLSELSSMTRLFWVTLHSMTHSFIM